ncbi:MAG: hypothetical protein IPI02_07940 [Sterolibacteriaceae bacterium]|nr:hypothetical protein [Sterolibacteriaceae bacterium]
MLATIYAKLREGHGLDEQLFAAALSQLRGLNERYAVLPSVPKPLAAALFDLSTALYSSAYLYPDEKRDAMNAKFDEFCDVARELLNS